MENNTANGHIEINEVTSKNQLNGDTQSHLYTNGHNERSNLMSPAEVDMDSNLGALSDVHNSTSDVRHLSSNLLTLASTDHTDSRTSRNTGSNDVNPLLETELIPIPKPTPKPPANPELDDDEPENDNVPKTPQNHPGVDDGFFPDIGPRVGNDEPKKPIPPNGEVPTARRPSVNSFPYPPGFNPLEGTPQIIPDVNVYQHKKTLAQGMMDLALLSANANQLRYVLESYGRHPYYYFSLVFISLSLILQIAVGIGLILNSRYDVRKEDDICRADRINNFTVLGIFLVTIVNVFVSSFGVADPVPSTMKG